MAERAARWLRDRGHAVDLVATRPDADAARAAAERATREGADRVLAVGGDGTVAEVAAGAIAGGGTTPIAIVAAGTANILALNLGIPRALEEALAVAAAGPVARIDAGRVDGVVFLLTVGAGLHADIVARTGRPAKRRWGVAAYAMAYLAARRAAEPSRYTVVCDGERIDVEGSMVQVMNCGSVFRRAWALAPDVSPVDGLLDVVVLRAASLPGQVAAAAHVLRGRPTDTDLVLHRRAERVTLEAYPPVRVQRDGETAGRTPVEIETLPGAVPVAVPEGSPWAG